MPRETNAAKRERAIEVCERLNRRYGPVECFLDHENPFRLLIAVLLSAQTTDAQVNKVTPQLFAQWPTPEAMALNLLNRPNQILWLLIRCQFLQAFGSR